MKYILVVSVVLNLVLAIAFRLSRTGPLKLPAAVTGVKATPLAVADLQGRSQVLRFSGAQKPTVVYYFRPGCHWCARNLSNINALADSGEQEFRFVGLSPNDGSLRTYVTESSIKFPVFSVTPQTKLDSIKLVGVTPQMIVISQDGEIVRNWIGALSDSRAKEVEAYFGTKLPGLLPDSSK